MRKPIQQSDSEVPVSIYRKDYAPPNFWVDKVEMGFDLHPIRTHVATRLFMRRNPDRSENDLILFGEDIKLLQLRLNGVDLKKSAYRLTKECLTIVNAPDEVCLEVETTIAADKNTTMSGLYVSNGNFYTQCEAEGFRKITYFPDRPDVMASFTVMLRGDKDAYPVLLSNGNLIEQGDLGDGRHYAKWEDPFKKPSYLFALVAGKLVCQEEKFKLQSGRQVLLQVWVEPGNLDKTQHAMDSLKKSIRWDEQRFGLELDLDRFMIVATSDFNMGAMENKGLNIFNTKYVLANPRVATDTDYAGIESVVGHEYFHNWTGNRVTCRDWFQLSLKEGLTVFRDQEFSGDLVGTETGRAVKRIEDVRVLRQLQFSEDAGPMAHPVRPDSFVEINNFYTVTIYEKGAEVVRMYYTLLGHEGFRRGMDLYFQRHDGQAVTCDDFRVAMADANGRDLKQFERWYSQAGTPRVSAQGHYDGSKKTYSLSLTQSCPKTAGQSKKKPFHIPVAFGLIDVQGGEVPLQLEGDTIVARTKILELTRESQQFVFVNVEQDVTPSLLRNFSAPVILEFEYCDEQLAHLLAYDSDPFCRWEAGQRLAMRRLLNLVSAIQKGVPLSLDILFLDALKKTLIDTSLDPAFRELVLTLPSEAMIAEEMKVADPQGIHQARQFARAEIAQYLKSDLLQVYQDNQTPGKYSPDALSAGKRALKNCALAYLVEWAEKSTYELAYTQYQDAENMTDRMAALLAMLHCSSALDKVYRKTRNQVLLEFYKEFQNDALVIDKWFTLQATAPTTDVTQVRQLMQHKAFSMGNPNRARSLIFAFCNANPAQFHCADGSGYEFWADSVIALNKLNPQVAARLARSLDRWTKYPKAQQTRMKAALERVAKTKSLSKDVAEVISKALAI
ncbi:aminopeptidase N [Undibacterium fentianense]|uniref:Aminopeptidase N n=1 Tax=Undibacterium fentianense TaxID=2828728 RepID=A0A941E1K5_9BURK|nr:aminopeptidase N [Undibacterium fentianense]MBR7799377.1 aminopeptidase N [Undibacterium fentianense]